MIGKKMEAALNKQMNREIYSAYLYAAMAADAIHGNLKGVGNWMTIQAKEEMTHAAKFFGYINDQQGRVTLDAIEAPPAKFKSALDMFQQTLKHEKFVTKSIHELAELAKEENDFATGIFLQWFITEQIEEEGSAAELVAQLEMVGSSVGSLLMIDRQLAKRAFKGS